MPASTGQDHDLPLFRQEVLRRRENRWLGTILLAPNLSPMRVLSALVLVLSLLTVIALLTTYTRKVSLTGWLVPDAGLVRVLAPLAGTVTALHVREGQLVRQGDPMLAISAELTSESGEQLGEAVIRSLQERMRVEARERGLQNSLAAEQIRSAEGRAAAIRGQQQSIVREVRIVREQIRLASELLITIRTAFGKGLIIRERLVATENDVLDKRASLERLLQQESILARELDVLTTSLREIPVQRDAQLAVIDRRILELDQQLAEIHARRSVVIKAPQSGIVSSVQVEPSSAVPQNVPVVMIVPENSVLVAHLYAPSRSIGLIQTGSRAFMRYEAFPYQRYGVQTGRVRSVSTSALSPAELPPQLTTFAGGALAVEPVYRVTIELDRQDIPSTRGAIHLQSGLRLEADVSLESRKVWRWVIAPIMEAITRPRP
jgi:membrane fusion protein